MSFPIAFDGGGTFFLFDMRLPPVKNDYPVLLAHAGALSYDDAELIADSFTQLVESQLG